LGLAKTAKSDFFGRDTTPNFKRRDIFGNDGTGGDYGTLADSGSGKDNGPWADKDIIFNGDRAEGVTKVRRMDVVFIVVDKDLAGNIDVIADSQAVAAIEKTMVANDGVVTNSDVGGVEKIGTKMNGGIPGKRNTGKKITDFAETAGRDVSDKAKNQKNGFTKNSSQTIFDFGDKLGKS